MIWTKLFIFFGFLVIILFGTAIYLNRQWKPLLSQQIQNAIRTSTDGLYAISFGEISVNIITGNSSIKNIVLTPDTSVYSDLVKKGKAPRHLFTVEVAELEMNRIHPFKIYFKRKLEMESLIVFKPKIQMMFQGFSDSQDSATDNITAYQRLSEYLRSIMINKISLQEVDFSYVDTGANINHIKFSQNLDIEIARLLIDSTSQFDQSKFFYTENISIRLLNYIYRTQNGMYNIKFKELTASTQNKNARFVGLRVEPRHSEMRFSKILKKRALRYDLRVNELMLDGVDYKAFNTNRRLIAKKLTITNSNLNIFLSKLFPRIDNDELLTFPQAALNRLSLETSINSIKIKNARIAYSEYSSKSGQSGKIFFDHLEGFITNFTNEPGVIAKNYFLKSSLTGLLMGKGQINTGLTLNLTDPAMSYTLNVHLGRINATLFNPILRPLTLIEIRNGSLTQAKVSLSGNYSGTRGLMWMKYSGLKVSLFRKQEDNHRLRKMSIASMAANVLVLKNDNPTPGEKLRVSEINFKRPDSASFINMNWKAVFKSIKGSIGIDEITKQKMEAKLQDLKLEKAERAERREERLKRRDKRKSK